MVSGLMSSDQIACMLVFLLAVATVGLVGVLTSVSEGGASARVDVSVLEGGLSQPVTVRLMAVGVTATGMHYFQKSHRHCLSFDLCMQS